MTDYSININYYYEYDKKEELVSYPIDIVDLTEKLVEDNKQEIIEISKSIEITAILVTKTILSMEALSIMSKEIFEGEEGNLIYNKVTEIVEAVVEDSNIFSASFNFGKEQNMEMEIVSGEYYDY